MPIGKHLKTYFLRGLAVLVPTIITIWIFVWGYTFIQENISSHIKNGLDRLITYAAGAEFVERHLDERWMDIALSVAGFLAALLLVCIVGALLASVVGRGLWRRIERFILNAPFLKQVYPYVKQITDFLLVRERKEKLFSRVVAVEYPRKGIWSLGFVTGIGIKKLAENVKKEFLTVLIPTSPTPFTGFAIMVPKQETVELDITVEEALRFAVSGGVITPSHKLGEDGVLILPEHKLRRTNNKKDIVERTNREDDIAFHD